MKHTLTNISHFAFFEALEELLNEFLALLTSSSENNGRFKLQADSLIDRTESFLKDSISPDADPVLRLLRKSYNSFEDYHWSKWGGGSEPEIKKELDRLDRFYKSLEQVKGYLMMVETLSEPENTVQFNGITDKTDFLLRKLNIVFGEETYSIATILNLNGIGFRSSEPHEIAEDLGRRGYVNPHHRYGKEDNVHISVKGANYIERKDRQTKRAKGNGELEKKLDNIIEHLTKLGHGQEIIFDEIGELRELQNKLSKKTWSQLLKGKLLDLALDRVISKETASFIYEYLTNSHFKLLEFP
ncbi:hypothetical protein [Pedobacter sp. R-06]|uniref:hypothetical protein n=1 Tax=Pedobacter sp. R-06 TaxID=3404051 RepID=UPI003CF6B292